jgi:succinyl-diaminopimelate desuccinylase
MTVTETDAQHNIQERLVALTRDMILIPSNTAHPDERGRCYEFIKNHLEALENIEVREFENKGIPSLVAAPPGCSKPQILMCGHLDVITHPDVTSYRSQIQDGRIYGPGAGDMKGALAVLLEIFRNIHTRLPNAPLGIAVTADEETGGESGVGFLVREKGLRCGSAMIPDGGSLNDITVEEKGILHLSLECRGHSAHAARPWLGENPIEKMMGRLHALKTFFGELKKSRDHWYPTCAVTVIGTENKTANRIPSNATAVLDVRFPPPYTLNKMLNDIKQICGPDVHAEVIIGAEPTKLSPDRDYGTVTKQLTGKGVRLVRDDGGSDARFLAAEGVPVMMSRPLVGNLHSEDEWIDIDSMVMLYRIYEKYLLLKFGGQGAA